MKNAKFAVLAAGLIGLVACFLPFVSFGSKSISIFGMRELAAGQAYLIIAAFAVPTIIGAMAASKRLSRGMAGGALAAFALAMVKLRPWGDTIKGAIGAKLLVVSAIVGLVAALVALASPERE